LFNGCAGKAGSRAAKAEDRRLNWFKSKLARLGDKSGLGLIAAYAIVAALIFGFQLFPLTGIFIMFAGGPLWIGLLVHVAMIHLSWRVIQGRIVRPWLIMPLIFYVGGYALHLASVHMAQSEATAIEARNSALRMQVAMPFTYLREGAGDTYSLMEHYKVERSFLKQGNGSITTFYYAKWNECERANAGWYYDKRMEPYLSKKDIFYYLNGKEKTRQCIISQDGLQTNWRYRITGRLACCRIDGLGVKLIPPSFRTQPG
jgi:hypothetical protein